MPSASQTPARAADLTDSVIATVREWVTPPADGTRRPRLSRSGWKTADVVRDAEGLEFATQFIELVICAADEGAAARNLERLSRQMPPNLPAGLRVLVQLAGGFSLLSPRALVPIVRASFRRSMRELVVDEPELGERIRELWERGIRVDVAPFGNAVLGGAAADRRLAAVTELLARAEVESVSVRLADLVGPHHPWAHDEAVERAIDRLEPLYEAAAAAATPKRITLEMGGRSELDYTLDVFTGLLSRPSLSDYEGGITLPVNLPDSLALLQGVAAWARERRAQGGASTRVRLVKGVPQPGALPSREAADAQVKRMLDWALRADRSESLTVVMASNNLFDLAFARELAERRGVASRLEIEMHLGATPYAEAVLASGATVTEYAPVVNDEAYGGVAWYLLERLREQADPASFRSAVPALAEDEELFEREAARFRASVDAMELPLPEPTPHEAPADAPALIDPATAEGRQWARGVLTRARDDAVESFDIVRDIESLDALIAASVAAGETWGARASAERVDAVLAFADALEIMRGQLVATLVRETGMTIAEADAEVVRAVALTRKLVRDHEAVAAIDNAEFAPAAAVLLAPSWTTPASDTADGIAAALLAGSAVVVQPAHQARHSAAVVVRAAHESGIAPELVTLVVPEDPAVARRALSHPDVGQVLFSGDRDTARLLRSWRPERPPLGDVRGVASVIVAASADIDAAASDIVTGAFHHAGQHPEGARLVILVGGMGESRELRSRIADAVRSLHPASSLEASARLGPLIGSPSERARRLLSLAGDGESWLVEPEALDDRLTLWRPGVRDGVDSDVAAQRVVDAPALVLTSVPDLETAIRLQNQLQGETAGIHTLDVDELAAWLDSVDCGSLHVNKATVGHPLDSLQAGGWRGAGAPRGSAERIMALGEWLPKFGEPQQSVRLEGIGDTVRALIEAAQPTMKFLEFDLVRAGAVSDERAWVERYRDAREEQGASGTRTVVRYLPVETTVRLSDGVSPAQLVRVLAAATRAGARVHISAAQPLPERLVQLFAHPLSPLRVTEVLIESDTRWHARLQSGEVTTPHIRLLGGDLAVLATVLSLRPDVALHAAPVTTSGRLELLPFLRAQVVSMTADRHGRPDPMVAQIEF
ncbi:MAG: proline dehydrogenase family protein [Salinibacterium sp.]|nr:proline dehydrogenase family protein [Salinibacterium sp.]MBF0672187.1 proline dehydrogenase family protein [Salinibacterium sp.]